MTSLESDPPTGRAADPASATTSPTPGSDPAPLPPGSPAALAAGCRCSVLANAAYRCGASGSPLIEPACTVVHAEPT